jgi:uncharacterized repeat protein (TIGR03803 family)
LGEYPTTGLTPLANQFYGTAAGGSLGNGVVYSLNPASGSASVVYGFQGSNDGTGPNGRTTLLARKGQLYGTTSDGGPYGSGTVFRLNPATGAKTILYSFAGGSDGGKPCSSLIDVGGALYGMTCMGGTANLGTVFRLVP